MKNVILLLSFLALNLFANVGSRENDSLALVAIKEANPDGNLTWNYDDSINNWHGVHLDSTGRVKQLGAIFYNGANITNLPKEIGDLTNLKTITLHKHGITSLPKEIGNLTNLESLILYQNEITELPPEIGNLTNLIALDLSNNQLTSLPKEFGNLANLKTIKLTNNQLDSIPDEVESLNNVLSLYLDSNKLAFGDFEKFTNNNELDTIAYFRQDTLGEIDTIFKKSYRDTLLWSPISGENNDYKWYRDGNLSFSTIHDSLRITLNGSYVCRARNSDFPNLILYHAPIVVMEPVSLIPSIKTLNNLVINLKNHSVIGTGRVQIILYDFKGRKHNVFDGYLKGTHKLDSSHLSTGVYITEIINLDTGSSVKEKLRIVK